MNSATNNLVTETVRNMSRREMALSKRSGYDLGIKEMAALRNILGREPKIAEVREFEAAVAEKMGI